jgi:hypothetical protein
MMPTTVLHKWLLAVVPAEAVGLIKGAVQQAPKGRDKNEGGTALSH